jgi:uncharacterized protein (DUF2267 family)
MSSSGLDIFDRTLQATHIWLGEIAETLGPDRQLAWHALGSVTRALRDRVPVPLAAHFGAQLPLLVRGLYYDRWRPTEPQTWRSADEFFAVLAHEFEGLRPIAPAAAAKAVFQVLNHHMDPGQVRKMREALPEEVRTLWPAAKGKAFETAA